tara:strand:+ start:246 stop:644 length:399 start_codon:yes stop_codon:yes gene_type:complete
MNKHIKTIIILVAIITILHIVSVVFGLYSKGIPLDKPQHILAGIVFGLIWIWLLESRKAKLTKPIFIISTISFAVFGSFLWELFEFAILNLAPSFANNFKIYSPNLAEAITDIVSGLIGGAIIGFWMAYKKK